MTPIPPYPQPVPYTRESIERAKQQQEWERVQAAKDMGIPSQLLELYGVCGFDQMDEWIALIHKAGGKS